MIDILHLFRSVLLLLLMMLPGILMKKIKMAPEGFSKGLSNLVLYIAQPALIIAGFIQPYDRAVLIRAGMVLLFSVLAHLLFAGIAFLVYRRGELGRRRVQQFATCFTNAGYMGIPLIAMLCGDGAAIYASVYTIVFHLFVWTLGCFIYTGDRQYISVKKGLLNPAVISIVFGVLIFLLPIDSFFTAGGSFVGTLLYELIGNLKALVAPLSMLIIGIRLADIEVRSILRDWEMYKFLLVRMFLSPALVFVLLLLVKWIGYYDPTVSTVVLLCSAAPSATATSMFSELYGGDSVYAGKLVAASTILSIASMPTLALLLKLL